MLAWIAVFSMLLDHVGILFYPHDPLFRFIGRLAMPIYCFGIVQGYLHTKNLKRYMGRLGVLSLVSQIPYMFLFDVLMFNVIFTLKIGLLCLWCLDYKKIMLFMILMMISVILPLDYGWYGIGLILIYRYTSSWWMIFYHALLNVLFWLVFGDPALSQFYSLLGTLVIIFSLSPMMKMEWKMNRLFYRLFYPVHLMILWIMKMIV